jgi:hypothetical protein
MKVTTFVLACVLFAGVPVGVHAHGGEPSPLKDVNWGMSPEEVKKVYPDLVLLAAAPEPSKTEAAIQLSLYRLVSQKVGEKLTCNIELKFLVDKLSYLDYYCRDKSDVAAYLEAEYGRPTVQGEGGWQWTRPTTTVSYSPVIGTFTVTQRRANDALQGAAFLYQMMQQNKQAEPQKAQETGEAVKPQ